MLTLSSSDDVIKLDTGPAAPSKMKCFNCDGEHNMAECSEPKNFANITKNKREHMNKRPSNV